MESAVEQNVVRFDIAMYDLWFDGMEVGERVRGLDGNGQTDRPGKNPLARSAPVKVVSDGAIGHELVHEEQLTAAVGGAAVEAYQVLVAEAGEDGDLIHELLEPSVVVLIQAFDSNDAAVSKLS